MVALLVVAFAITWIFATSQSGTTQKASPEPNANREDMSLSVRQTTARNATGIEPGGDPVIAIKNLNSFDWRDCKLVLNDIYSAHLDFIDTPTTLGAGTSTYDSMIVTEKQFATADGTLFDLTTQVPLKISAACSQPYISAWVGTFSG
jgi:hypothetical protein